MFLRSDQKNESNLKSSQILGRDFLLETCRNFLNLTILNYFKLVEYHTEDFGEKTSCIVIRGETQQGKTRLLEEIYQENMKDNLNCIRVNLKATQLTVSLIHFSF